ncbi:MAG: hypothetical protein HDT28_09000 [Clostridiales bacterium]|nr:hypothetical protein [Clostridiales bacterium]
MISLSLLGLDSYLIIYLALVILGIICIIFGTIFRNKLNTTSRPTKKPSSNNSNAGDAPLAVGPVNKKVMTESEKKCYDYFFADSNQGGCLHKVTAISDDEYDSLVTEKLNEFGSKSKALKKIGLDISQVEEIEPIRFYGFEKYNNRLTDVYASKAGNDGRVRSSVCSVTWIFFSNDQLCIYNGRFDMLSGSKIETTDEYFYRDITNVTTKTDTEQVTKLNLKKGCFGKVKEDIDKQFTDYETFLLVVPGDSFVCSVSGVTNAAQTIEGMKQKLREKKNA